MGFRFSLAAVLAFRESVERREELSLQQIVLEIAHTHHQIEQLTVEIAQAQESLNKAMKQPMTAFQLQNILAGVDSIVARKKALQDSLVPLEQRREVQRMAYQAANRSRRMLSDMKDRQRDIYDQESARKEQKMLDDIFGARAQRN
jgi:flagellar export protein FliJ